MSSAQPTTAHDEDQQDEVVEVQPGRGQVFRRRRKTKRIQCAECKKVINVRDLYVRDGRGEQQRILHLICAGFISAEGIKPCDECFCIPPCMCIGS